jgi:hypothetical protein
LKTDNDVLKVENSELIICVKTVKPQGVVLRGNVRASVSSSLIRLAELYPSLPMNEMLISKRLEISSLRFQKSQKSSERDEPKPAKLLSMAK